MQIDSLEKGKKEPALIINGEIIECKFIMCKEECQHGEHKKERCHRMAQKEGRERTSKKNCEKKLIALRENPH